MSPGLTDDQRRSLQQHPEKPIEFRDEKTKRLYFIVDPVLLDRAQDAMRRLADLAAIQEGIADLEAGRGLPVDEADRQIREKLGFPPRA